jgi:hypothetical protein
MATARTGETGPGQEREKRAAAACAATWLRRNTACGCQIGAKLPVGSGIRQHMVRISALSIADSLN